MSKSTEPKGKAGNAGIYSFPFRIYGPPDLPAVEVTKKDQKVHVHAPTQLRAAGMPLSPDYPPNTWPLFRWSPWLGKKKRVLPPSQVRASPSLGGAYYDAFRVDYWGDDPFAGLQGFVRSFLGWLRHFSGQAWIDSFESHTDQILKYGFAIDANGRATESPWASGHAGTGPKWVRPVGEDVWRASAAAALDGPLPVYWELFHDAEVALAHGNRRAMVLFLALALEVFRDTRFPEFASTKKKQVVGEVLVEPLDGTDLLKHLSTGLESAHPNGLNVEKGLPGSWPWIKSLYTTRHSVAHGGPVAGLVGSDFKMLEDGDVKNVRYAVHAVIEWLEAELESS